MTRLTLRPYQEDALAALDRYYASGKQGNVLLVMPTGSGKALVISEILRRSFGPWPNPRILVLSHVRELVEQDFLETFRLWPEAPMGIHSAGLKRRDVKQPILFCTIQTVAKKADVLQWADLVIVDEAHLIPRADGSMYQRLIKDLRGINPRMKVIGLTATPYRLDSGMLTGGKDALFDEVAYDVPVRLLVELGHLVPLRSKSTLAKLDVAGVTVRAGEYVPAELQKACDVDEKTRAIADEIVTLGQDRRAWLVFAAGIQHAEHLAEALRERGIATDCVFGETPGMERDTIINRFRSGELRALVNVGVLTTGFNVPHVDLLALCRPTKSTGLYVQMGGRGTRTADGKSDCLLLDFGGNVDRHGPIDAVDVRKAAAAGEGDAPTRTCPECREIVALATRICPACGHEFPPPPPVSEKLTARASAAPAMSFGEPEWLEVHDVRFALHEKRQRPDEKPAPPTLRVDYQCGYVTRSEWVCVEHPLGGFARRKAQHWWVAMGGEAPIPGTVAAALERTDELRRATRISVQPEGKFWRVVSHELGERPEPTPPAPEFTNEPEYEPFPEYDPCPF